MTRSAKGLSMITINLDGFSLANCRRFAKFVKLSPRQTFPLYGTTKYSCFRSMTTRIIMWTLKLQDTERCITKVLQAGA